MPAPHWPSPARRRSARWPARPGSARCWRRPATPACGGSPGRRRRSTSCWRPGRERVAVPRRDALRRRPRRAPRRPPPAAGAVRDRHPRRAPVHQQGRRPDGVRRLPHQGGLRGVHHQRHVPRRGRGRWPARAADRGPRRYPGRPSAPGGPVLNDELALLDATAQAELVRAGQVSAAELVTAAIERIETLNPVLNAVVTPAFERAAEAVRTGFAGRAGPAGPFAGVPYLVKDLACEMKGVRFTEGSRFLAGNVSAFDSELVLRLRRAGLVILGKTSTPEFGMAPACEPVLFGPVRNPWDTGRSTSGSSGGSAAAVASGMVPFAHGNDLGGSLRYPASACGLFALKPTRARNPLGPEYGDIAAGGAAEHALTRSVRDSAALLDATAGPDLGDPYWAPPPARPFAEEVGRDPGRLRIAFTAKAPTGVATDLECVKAVREAANLCADLGHEVEEDFLKIDGERFSRSFIDIWAAGN